MNHTPARATTVWPCLGDSQGSSNTEADAPKKRAREAKSFWSTHLGQPARCAKIRKVPMLPKSVGTARSRRTQGMRRDDVSSLVARGRLEEVQGEGFIMENNNIVCTGCGCNISSAKSAMVKHISTKKHQERKAMVSKKKENQDMLLNCINVWKVDYEQHWDRLAQLEVVSPALALAHPFAPLLIHHSS